MKTLVAAFIISLVRFIGMLIVIGIDIGIFIDMVLLTGIVMFSDLVVLTDVVMFSDIVLLPGIAMFSFAAKATPKESVKRMDAIISPINMLLFIFLPLIFLYELISQMTFGQNFQFRLGKITFQIMSGIHAGAPLGFFTSTRSPVNIWIFLVPPS
jgi:hypothetical protein